MTAAQARAQTELNSGKISYEDVLQYIRKAVAEKKYSVRIDHDIANEAHTQLMRDGYRIQGLCKPFTVSW